MKWRTRDGRRLTLAEMSCRHLRNALNMILRDNWRQPWLASILAELERRCKTPPPTRGTEQPKEKVGAL